MVVLSRINCCFCTGRRRERKPIHKLMAMLRFSGVQIRSFPISRLTPIRLRAHKGAKISTGESFPGKGGEMTSENRENSTGA